MSQGLTKSHHGDQVFGHRKQSAVVVQYASGVVRLSTKRSACPSTKKENVSACVRRLARMASKVVPTVTALGHSAPESEPIQDKALLKLELWHTDGEQSNDSRGRRQSKEELKNSGGCHNNEKEVLRRGGQM